jgi:hypothetical protein
MNEIEDIKVTSIKKQKNFLSNAIELLEIFCLKLKKSKENNCNTIKSIKKLNLPTNVEAELFAKFYNESEENRFKHLKN